MGQEEKFTARAYAHFYDTVPSGESVIQQRPAFRDRSPQQTSPALAVHGPHGRMGHGPSGASLAVAAPWNGAVCSRVVAGIAARTRCAPASPEPDGK